MVMNDKRAPHRRTPPGETIRRELEARGWTQKELAEIMDRPEQAISEIIAGKKEITSDTAIELAQAFGTSAEFWSNLEANYRLWLALRDPKADTIDRRARLYALAPVREMKRKGWIGDTDNIDKLEEKVKAFLEIKSLHERPTCAVALRRSSYGIPEERALMAWVKRVEHLVRPQKVGDFHRAALEKAIPGLLELSTELQSMAEVPHFLLELGIRFALVPHLTGTFLDGAMFRINGNPVVALSLRYDRLDSFWFTLMHELAHLVADHKGAFLDTIYDREGSVSREEARADRMARDWLVDAREYRSFVDRTRPYFSGKKIREFALSVQRHPAIVLGRLQFDGEVPWNHLRSLHDKVKPVLLRYYDRPIAA